MNIEFGKQDGGALAPVIDIKTEVVPTPDPETKVECTTTVAAPLPPPAVQTPMGVAPSGLVLGDKLPEFKDIILPRLNLVQNIGLLKDQFPPGSVVFGQNTLVYAPQVNDKATGNVKTSATAPVELVVLGFRPTRFVEKVIGGARGLIVDTEDAVRANGGTLDFNEAKLKAKDGMKLFQPLADAVIALKRPSICADDGTVFVYPIEGHKYALGLWSMKGTAYTAAAKRVFFTNRAVGCLRGGYPTRHVALTTKEESFQGTTNKAWVPICLLTKETSPEFLAFVASVLSGS